MTDTKSVWSLDLETGETIWTRDIAGYGGMSCLPGAGLVAVITMDPEDESLLGATLVNATSGAEVAELTDDSLTHVIPLGPIIGLVDDTNLLTAVDPQDLDSPLWSHQLDVAEGELGAVMAEDVDDDVAQVIYSSIAEPDDRFDAFTLAVSVMDGSSPAWAQEPSAGVKYQRLGDVIAYTGWESSGVFDVQGEKLWDLGDDQLGTAGTSLYVSWPSSSDPSTGYTNLHKVDARTGSSVGANSYQGWFDSTVAVKDHIAVLTGGTLHILDDRLEDQTAIAVTGFYTIHEGESWVYTVSSNPDPNTEMGDLLSAIDPDGGRVLWIRELERSDSVSQLGRHLVIFSEDGTLHGLASR